MGQKPDYDYDPERIDPRCYYTRDERLSLPNAPRPLKRKRVRIWVMIIFDLLLLYFGWQCVLDLRRDAARKMRETEISREGFVYLSRAELRNEIWEVKLLVSQTNRRDFLLATNAQVRFRVEKDGAKTSQKVYSLGLELPQHIFRAEFPEALAGGEIQVSFEAGGSPPSVEIEF